MDFNVASPTATHMAIDVTFTADEVSSKLDQEIRTQQKNFTMPGFRKGKVPINIILKRFGEEINAKATQNAIDKAIDKILTEKDISPISEIIYEGEHPGLFQRGSAYSFKIGFDIYPQIQFPDFSKFEANQSKVTVTDEQVDSFIDKLRIQHAKTSPITEPRLPQKDDLLEVTFQGFDSEQKPVEELNGTLKFTVGNNEVIADFESAASKLHPGEECDAQVTFPTDYNAKQLAGNTYSMHIKLNHMEKKDLPEANDEFAKKLGANDLKDLRDIAQTQLFNEMQSYAINEVMTNLVHQALTETPEFELPKTLLDARMKYAEDQFHKSTEKSENPPSESDVDQWRTEAKKNIEQALREEIFLLVLAMKNDLKATQSDMEMAIIREADRYGVAPQAIADLYKQKNMLPSLANSIVVNKALGFIYQNAKVHTEGEEDEKSNTTDTSNNSVASQDTPTSDDGSNA